MLEKPHKPEAHRQVVRPAERGDIERRQAHGMATTTTGAADNLRRWAYKRQLYLSAKKARLRHERVLDPHRWHAPAARAPASAERSALTGRRWRVRAPDALFTASVRR